MTSKKRLLAVAGVALLSTTVLAACGNGGSNSSSKDNKTYTYVYQTDPESLDYTVVNKTATSDVATNLVDGLLENDKYGNLVPSLAKDWSVSKDGKTYTYELRDNAKWFTSDGEEYADVTAEDFVTGLKHAADAKSEALYLVQDSIVGLKDYVDGKVDFDQVGVKAVDDKTVEYTLNDPETYWNSKVVNGVLFPVNAEFLKSQGDDFGSANPDSILYNGAYLLSAWTNKSSLEYTKNENYWDADKVEVENIKLTYYDGSDQESLINNFADGVYTAATVYPNSSNYDSVKKEFGDNITYGQTGGSAFFGVFNTNRTKYDLTKKENDEQKESTKKAILNKDFRQAINFALDREAYASQRAGKDGAANIIRNSVTPPTFVSVGDQSFGDVVEKELVSYGDEWKDVDLSDGQNGLYNVDKAKAEFDKAKKALEADGVQFPIHLDLPTDQASEYAVQAASSFKQSVENALGKENVVIDINQTDEDTYYNATYYAETPDQNDYDISTASGWGPDYQDPSTYLDIFSLDSGASLHQIGLTPGEANDLAKELGVDKYSEMTATANEEKQDTEKRYEEYAKAQAWLTDSSLMIPTFADGGTPRVSKVQPFSASYSLVGIKGGQSFKYLKIQDDTVTTKGYESAVKKWKKAREKSNAKYQEKLEDHVK